jgi:hypothetical protein
MRGKKDPDKEFTELCDLEDVVSSFDITRFNKIAT